MTPTKNMPLVEAVATLRGFFDDAHYSISTVAIKLDCSPDWVRAHLNEFPNRWRQGIVWKIPARDVAAYAARHAIKLS